MKIKYCLPIIKNTKKEVLKSLEFKGYHFYEIWLDYIKDLDDQFIFNIAQKYNGKLIFLFRRKNLKKVNLSLERRKEIILILKRFSVFVDIDFLTQFEDLEMLGNNIKTKLILSYHNYKETPKFDYLNILINKMMKYNPDIFKIATFCKAETDSLNLLTLLLKLKEQKIRYIILGMGKKGLITRIAGALWGNEINFTPDDLTEKSADGQLTMKQLEMILKEIK